jgi:general secretion pathway protein G
MSSNRNARRGFTLTELMVVIVILGLLATLVVPRVLGRLLQSRVTIAEAEVQSIASAVKEFSMNNNGRLPETLDQLVTPDENGLTYLEDRTEVPVDPWGNEYWYEPDPNGISFEVGSYGADGEPGGEAANSDITNKTIAGKRKAKGQE